MSISSALSGVSSQGPCGGLRSGDAVLGWAKGPGQMVDLDQDPFSAGDARVAEDVRLLGSTGERLENNGHGFSFGLGQLQRPRVCQRCDVVIEFYERVGIAALQTSRAGALHGAGWTRCKQISDGAGHCASSHRVCFMQTLPC